jgi:hypothetical protein
MLGDSDRGPSAFPSHQACRSLDVVTVADQATVQIFPVEIVYAILQHADKTQLLSFALTCRRYQPEVERLLYKDIKFAKYDKYTRVCLKTLVTVPRKALFVQSFWIHWGESLNRPTLKKATYKLLGEALLAMTSLKVLHLRFYQNTSEPARPIMNTFLRYARGIPSPSRRP